MVNAALVRVSEAIVILEDEFWYSAEREQWEVDRQAEGVVAAKSMAWRTLVSFLSYWPVRRIRMLTHTASVLVRLRRTEESE